MQMSDNGSAGTANTRNEADGALRRRMARLGLGFEGLGFAGSETFEKIERRCTTCEFRDACASDLEHDPTSQAWEAYCANAPALNTLAALTEALGSLDLSARILS